MLRKILMLVLPFFALFVFSGCASKPEVIKTRLDQFFERDFKGFEVPEINKIKLAGKGKSFPYATFDEVWHSAIIVLMQQGIVVRLSKESGVIITVTTPPLALFVERGGVVTVYLHIMDDLYKRVDTPEKVARRFPIQRKEEILDGFFGMLSTQIYSGKKWKYLYKGPPND
ncbi:MAG: hypothetical protein B5M53_09070 [Candidatus Cloacimonas sp. 4484_209]|nr:MAG: hypothetical protein B5M53_09070 [Candidatus Cloacimonas sp. 4484_209]